MVCYGYGPSTGRDGPPIILPMTTGMTTAMQTQKIRNRFTSQFTRNQLTDADKERISNIGGKSIFLADGGRSQVTLMEGSRTLDKDTF